MPFLAPLSLSAINLQVSAFRANLQLQPNAGTEEERSGWLRALDQSVALAGAPVGRLARVIVGDGWNLRRAKGILDRTAAQAAAAGLFIADLGGRWAANETRFGTADAATAKARMYVLGSKSVHEERSHEMAERLIRALFESKVSSYETLVAMLDRAFAAHIRRLDECVLMLPDLVVGDVLPKNVAYPHYFEDAHPPLMDYLRRALATLNDGEEVPWDECRREAVGLLIERQTESEGIFPGISDSESHERGLALAMQIPDYSAFQLFCLLRQIQMNKIEDALVEELKRSRNGRILTLGDALSAGILSQDLFKASELMGNIDIIHANIGVAHDLAKREQPEVDEKIVALRVKAAVARLGKATGSSRPEYNDAIERLRRLEAEPETGRLIPLSRRRP